jgi:protein-S-isoprenylcysteine O-methyltransferase Ste14
VRPHTNAAIEGDINMIRLACVVYGVIAYVAFLASFLYAVGFVGNWVVPKSIDSPEVSGPMASLLVNALLLGLFAIQHSVMARPSFKAMWTKIVPRSIERSTYVLISSLLLILIFWQWRPMMAIIWDVAASPMRMALQGLCWIGWLVALLSTFMVSHWDLFGLRQVFLHLQGKACGPLAFRTSALYGLVRHPLMLGFIIAFWATPTMSLGHLVFAAATTAYILIALQFEERDLIDAIGDAYVAYKKRVPMLLPWPRSGGEP